ncbi:hypothetical protein Tco_0993598 [Tanacetum coccineum]
MSWGRVVGVGGGLEGGCAACRGGGCEIPGGDGGCIGWVCRVERYNGVVVLAGSGVAGVLGGLGAWDLGLRWWCMSRRACIPGGVRSGWCVMVEVDGLLIGCGYRWMRCYGGRLNTVAVVSSDYRWAGLASYGRVIRGGGRRGVYIGCMVLLVGGWVAGRVMVGRLDGGLSGVGCGGGWVCGCAGIFLAAGVSAGVKYRYRATTGKEFRRNSLEGVRERRRMDKERMVYMELVKLYSL